MRNIDILAGVDIFSFIDSQNKWLNQSSLIFQTGLRVIFSDSYFIYSNEYGMHFRFWAPQNNVSYIARKTDFHPTIHINYSYNIFQNLVVNVNLNYGFIHK